MVDKGKILNPTRGPANDAEVSQRIRCTAQGTEPITKGERGTAHVVPHEIGGISETQLQDQAGEVPETETWDQAGWGHNGPNSENRGEHSLRLNCSCDVCHDLCTEDKCAHPFKCLTMAVQLLSNISPEWDPTNNPLAPIEETGGDVENLDKEDILVEKLVGTQSLVECITIFREKRTEEAEHQEPASAQNGDPARLTIAYTDRACLENGTANATAGAGVWYRMNNPRNRSEYH